MRVVVTGGAGFIGSHVVEALLAQGHTVVVVDNLSHGDRSAIASGADFIHGDILTPDRWMSKIGTADILIHLAAQVSVPVSESNPEVDVRTNVLGTVAMLQAARAFGCREFRFASSAAVYGDNPRVPLAETETPAPLSYYGLDKWVAEQYIGYESSRTGMTGTILRLANVYGPRQRAQGEGGVVAIFSEALALGQTPRIEGDGLQTRDFVSVWDVARAFVFRLGNPGDDRVLNISTGTATSILDLWNQLSRFAAVNADRVGHLPARAGDIRHSRLKTDRADNWGYHATTPLNEGLRETYRWFSEVRGRA